MHRKAAYAAIAAIMFAAGPVGAETAPQDVVFDDADLDRAVPTIIKAIMQNAGQTCTAGSRVLVQKTIYEALVARLSKAFAQAEVATPLLDRDCGPVINRQQQQRVIRYCEQARADGIPVLAQAKMSEYLPSAGFYVRPTLFGPVPATHPLAREEVFGPVLAVLPFEDEAEAIALANGTPYGLIAAVWSENGGRQSRVANAMRVGQVFINCYGAGGGVELPFGGVKASGHGREKGLLALEEMSSAKTILQFHG